MERTFTTPQVARILQVSSKTVYKWVRAGTLAAYRTSHNGRYRILESEVRRHAAENKIPLPDTLN